MYTSEALLAYISLTVVGLVLLLLLVEHFERRLARRVSEANREVVKDVAVLHGEAKTLVEFARLGLINTTAPHPAPPVAPSPTPPSPEIGEQLREMNAQLRQLNRLITSLAAPPTPQATPAPPAVESAVSAPAPASRPSPEPASEPKPPATAPSSRSNQRSPVSARVLDAVLAENLSNSLVYMHEQGGTVASEHEIPGASQAVAKLLSLRLARADDRGIYLTDAGRDIASLLTSVSR